MSDLSLLATIWAAVGASGLGVGGVGVFMTRRRLRQAELPAPVGASHDSSHGVVEAA